MVLTPQTVLKEVFKHLHNNNAMPVPHAHKEQHGQMDHAEPQDQIAFVIRSTTLLQTLAELAKLVTYHKTVLVEDKI